MGLRPSRIGTELGLGHGPGRGLGPPRPLPAATTSVTLRARTSALVAASSARLQAPPRTPSDSMATAGGAACAATHSRPGAWRGAQPEDS